MSLHQCPGPDRKNMSVPEDVTCPECGEIVEMWTSETQKICPACSKTITRDQLDANK